MVDDGSADSLTQTHVAIELNNVDPSELIATQIAFDFGVLRFEIDGSFPRDIDSIYNWSQSGFGIMDIVNQSNASVDAFRIEFPGEKLFEVSKDGIVLSLPYTSTADPAPAGSEYALQFTIAGDFTHIVDSFPWSTELTDAELANTLLTQIAISDVITDTTTGAVTNTQDQIALTLGTDLWVFNIDELQLILEGNLVTASQPSIVWVALRRRHLGG